MKEINPEQSAFWLRDLGTSLHRSHQNDRLLGECSGLLEKAAETLRKIEDLETTPYIDHVGAIEDIRRYIASDRNNERMYQSDCLHDIATEAQRGLMERDLTRKQPNAT